MAAILLAIALLGGVLLAGGVLPDPSPIHRLGHLAYELDGDVWIADPDGTDAVLIADGDEGRRFQSPQWSRDGRTLSVYAFDPRTADPYVLYQADGDGRGLRQVVRDDFGWVTDVSPSGGQRLFFVPNDALLTIVDAEGRLVEVPAPAGFVNWNYPGQASWMPDGTRIVVGACTTSNCKGGIHALFSVPVSGGLPTRLTPDDADI